MSTGFLCFCLQRCTTYLHIEGKSERFALLCFWGQSLYILIHVHVALEVKRNNRITRIRSTKNMHVLPVLPDLYHRSLGRRRETVKDQCVKYTNKLGLKMGWKARTAFEMAWCKAKQIYAIDETEARINVLCLWCQLNVLRPKSWLCCRWRPTTDAMDATTIVYGKPATTTKPAAIPLNTSDSLPPELLPTPYLLSYCP